MTEEEAKFMDKRKQYLILRRSWRYLSVWNWETFHLVLIKYHLFCKSSQRRCSVRKMFLENFAKLTGKQLCQGLFFNKVAGLSHNCFPVNFAKILRTPFLQNTSRRLLLFAISAIQWYDQNCSFFQLLISRFPKSRNHKS